MTYTIDEIKKIVTPIVKEYGIDSLSLFGSYARGEATEDSDLDFIMDKGDLNGVKYFSLIDKLESKFKCHVDLVSKESSNKEFLNEIKKDEILLYKRKR